MIPLRDENPTRHAPVVTWTLAAVNVACFLALVAGWIPETWMLVPKWVTVDRNVPSLVTSMFLHGGWMHLAGNLLYLIVFGNNVEDAMGRGKFVAFYLICGVAAGAAQIAPDPLSMVPMVGASGAIAGVLGAYMVLYPRARVRSLVLGLIVVDLPAWGLLGFWIVWQVLAQAGGTLLGEGASSGGVAYLAHIGGFVAGLATVRIFVPKGAR